MSGIGGIKKSTANINLLDTLTKCYIQEHDERQTTSSMASAESLDGGGIGSGDGLSRIIDLPNRTGTREADFGVVANEARKNKRDARLESDAPQWKERYNRWQWKT